MSTKKKSESKPKFTSNIFYNIILFILPFVVYYHVSGYDFSYHDDDIMLINNASALKSFDIKKIFLTDAWLLDKGIELYRPWQSFTYAVDFKLGATTAKGFHLHNILIYCACLQALFYLLMLLGIDKKTSFILSLFYSVHFVLAHTVSWIPARGDLYLFFFSVLSIMAIIKYFDTQKIIYAIATPLLFFLAMLSKESGIVLLPIMLAIILALKKTTIKDIKLIIIVGVSIVLAGIYLYMRNEAVAKSSEAFTFSGFLLNLRILPESFTKFYVPAFFSVMPGFDDTVTTIGIILILALLATISIYKPIAKENLFIPAIIIFFLPTIPSLIYNPKFTQYSYNYLDHRLFFPGLGLLLLTYLIVKHTKLKLLPSYSMYLIIVFVAIVSYANSTNYENYKAYYTNATTTNPNSGLAFMNFGTMYARENNYPMAFEKFYKAKEVMPTNIELLMKIADSHMSLKQYDYMNNICDEVLKINTKFVKAYYNKAVALAEQKDTLKAVEMMNYAYFKDSLNTDYYYYSGFIYDNLKMSDTALVYFQKAIDRNPKLARAYFMKGYIYGNLSKFKEALEEFKKYVALAPEDGNGYFYLGQAYCVTGNRELGCINLNKAKDYNIPEAQAKIDYYCR
jgi:tetratricopeptide (TPR) repeat protein